jgi:hypothetical protein
MWLRRIAKIIGVFLGIILTLVLVLFCVAYFSKNASILLPVKHKDAFFAKDMDNFPDPLRVEGKALVGASGEPIVLKGLMPPDPSRLHKLNRFKKSFLEGIKETGANVVRIPVHPEEYSEDEDYLWRYLDPTVAWAGELGMYVIIDWHYIGNIEDGSGGEMPDIDINPKEFSRQFWTLAADYFKDAPNVIFEIFNEPANIDAGIWAENAQELVDIIRAQGAGQPIIVGGINYSKDLSWVKETPIDDENIIYASHIYPAVNSLRWGDYFGEVAESHPVLITEWGFMDDNRSTTEQYFLVGDEGSYGAPLLHYLEEKGVGWIACWFDETWEPQIFHEDFKSYTSYGRFVMRKLRGTP